MALTPFAQELVGVAAPPPLTYDDLLRSPLVNLVRPFRLRVGTQVGYLNLLSGVRDAQRS